MKTAGDVPVWALTGPTGTGKSEVAVALAEAVGAELIGCDSIQLYRGLDCASAKPDAAARSRVPHHLVDCCDPSEPLDVKGYCERAAGAVARVRARGRTPLLVGGTGLYLRALSQGLIEVPSEPGLRAELTRQAARDPGGTYRRLQQLDPEGALGVHPNNPARLIRALEICLLTGQPASAVRRAHALRGPGPEALRLCVVALDGPDAWLRPRLVARSEAMVAAGLVGEVRGLVASGLSPDAGPLRAVGYRQASLVLAGTLAEAELAAAIAAATWAYVRRQRTWLRREPPYATLDAAAPPDAGRTARLTERLIALFRRGAGAGPEAPSAPAGPTAG